jgi:hypothetical protein
MEPDDGNVGAEELVFYRGRGHEARFSFLFEIPRRGADSTSRNAIRDDDYDDCYDDCYDDDYYGGIGGEIGHTLRAIGAPRLRGNCSRLQLLPREMHSYRGAGGGSGGGGRREF